MLGYLDVVEEALGEGGVLVQVHQVGRLQGEGVHSGRKTVTKYG